jgi:hypothetical protein
MSVLPICAAAEAAGSALSAVGPKLPRDARLAWHVGSSPGASAHRRGALDGEGVERLAERPGSPAGTAKVSAAPRGDAARGRSHAPSFAKKPSTRPLGFNEVAFASGLGSLRRFNSADSPHVPANAHGLRRLARGRVASDPECYRFRLTIVPYDWDAMLGFDPSHTGSSRWESVIDGRLR